MHIPRHYSGVAMGRDSVGVLPRGPQVSSSKASHTAPASSARDRHNGTTSSHNAAHQGMMRRPPSMLFDLEMEEMSPNLALDSEALSAVQAVHNLVARCMTGASQAVRDVEAACQALAQHGRVCTSTLAAMLARLGYRVSLRESLGGGAGGQCLRNLRHSCLVLQQQQQCNSPVNPADTLCSPNSSPSSSIIVDPSFKEQFAIAHPSPRYAAVLEAVPAVFVGLSSKIQPLVELLCAEMSLAFHSTGIVLPPWRYAKSMLSKWQPRRSVDLSLPPAAPSTVNGAAAASACRQLQQTATAAGTHTAPSTAASRAGSDAGSSALQGFNGISSSNNSSSTQCSVMAASGPTSSSGQSTAARRLLLDASAPQHVLADARTPPTVVRAAAAHQPDDQDQDWPALLGQSSYACGLPAAAAAAAAQPVPVQRQQSRGYEPLHRVVGGFGLSMAAAGHGTLSLVQ